MRSRDIVTVVPRNGDALTTWLVRAADGAEATGAETAAGFAAASISSRRIRPPIPVPVTVERLTPSSEASFLTIGVTYESEGWVTGGVAAATGAAGGGV